MVPTANNGILGLLDGTSDGYTASVKLNGALTSNQTYLLPNAGGTICISTGNCTSGHGYVGGSGTSGDLSVFTGAGTIGNSANLSETTGAVTDSGSLAIQGSSGLTLGVSSTANGSITFNNGTNSNTTVLQSGAASSDVTLTLPTTAGTSGQCLGTSGGGVLDFTTCLSGGTGSGVTTLNGQSGVVNIADASGLSDVVTIRDAGYTGTLGLSTFNSSYFNVASGAVSLATTGVTAASYGSSTAAATFTVNAEGQITSASTTTLANAALQNSSITLSNGSNITGGGTVSLGGTLTLGVSSSPTFSGNLAVQGTTGITVGSTANNGILGLLDGTSDGYTASVKLNGALTSNQTYYLPTADPGTLCTTAGNCAGVGGGITGSGTSGDLSVFTGAGTIGNSANLSETTGAVTDSGSLAIQGSSGLTLGVSSTANGSITFNNGTNSNTTVLQSGAASSDVTLTLPTTAGTSGQCLGTSGGGVLDFTTCLSGGTGSGVTTLNGQSGVVNIADASGLSDVVTIQDAGYTGTLGLSTFNSSYFNVASGAVSLATTGVTAASYGSSTAAATFTVNAEGQITSASTTTLANAALQNSSITLSNGSNITGGGTVSLGGTLTLGVSSSPTFSGTLTVSTIDSAASTDLDISAGSSNNIDFTADGRTFSFPTTGASSQTICTTGITCASGGGQAVLLQPGSAQSDTGVGSSIFINNTGGGNLIELQGAGSDEFVVANNGNTTVGGDLTVSSTISSATNTNLSIDAGSNSNGISFTSNGRTFSFPTTGASSQTICTTGITCASGGGQAVLLQPGSAQSDTGVGSSIFINNTGGGNLIELQGAGSDEFVVANNGNTTVGGTLLVDSNGSVDGNLAVQGTTGITVGSTANNGILGLLDGTSDGYTASVKLNGALTSNQTYYLPTADPGTLCTTAGNCASVTTLNGQSGVVNIADASGLSDVVTIQDAGYTGTLGLSTFNSSYFNVASGAVSLATTGVTAASYGSSTAAATFTVNAEGQITSASTTTLANAALQNSSITLSNGSNITGGGTVSLGGTLTLGVSSSPTFSGNLAVQGTTGITVGSTANNGILGLLDGTSDGYTASVKLNGALTSNQTYYLPTADPGTLCTTAGNRAGVGGGITGSGTSGDLSVFTGAGTIGNSANLSETTGAVTDSGSLAIQGSSGLTLGVSSTANGSITFNNGTNSNTTVLQSGAKSSYVTLTLPTTAGTSGQCLGTSGGGVLDFTTCLSGGTGSGVATTLNGQSGVVNIADASGLSDVVTIQDAGYTGTLGLSTFNSSYFNVASGAVSLATTGVTAASYGSSTAAATFTVNAEGQITSASTTTLANAALQNSSITLSNGSNITGGGTVSLGGTLTLGVSSSPTFSGNLAVQRYSLVSRLVQQLTTVF